jgi:type II secretory pathway predicted ATPase ExeA
MASIASQKPGHPKLKNDLRRSSMEEIGSSATIFELEGLGSERRKYLKWLLAQSVAPKTKIESVITDDAVAMLGEKLSTPLQFEYYLTRALEEAYKSARRGQEKTKEKTRLCSTFALHKFRMREEAETCPPVSAQVACQAGLERPRGDG